MSDQEKAATTVCPCCHGEVQSTKSVPVQGGSALFEFNCETCAAAGWLISLAGADARRPGLFFRRSENL